MDGGGPQQRGIGVVLARVVLTLATHVGHVLTEASPDLDPAARVAGRDHGLVGADGDALRNRRQRGVSGPKIQAALLKMLRGAAFSPCTA